MGAGGRGHWPWYTIRGWGKTVGKRGLEHFLVLNLIPLVCGSRSVNDPLMILKRQKLALRLWCLSKLRDCVRRIPTRDPQWEVCRLYRLLPTSVGYVD
jgi:hypothetical protein